MRQPFRRALAKSGQRCNLAVEVPIRHPVKLLEPGRPGDGRQRPAFVIAGMQVPRMTSPRLRQGARYPQPIPTPIGMFEPGMGQRRRHTGRHPCEAVQFVLPVPFNSSGQVDPAQQNSFPLIPARPKNSPPLKPDSGAGPDIGFPLLQLPLGFFVIDVIEFLALMPIGHAHR